MFPTHVDVGIAKHRLASQYVDSTPRGFCFSDGLFQIVPIVLLLAALGFISAFIQEGEAQGWIFTVTAGFVMAYFLTRRALISITSNGGDSIQAPAKSMNRSSIVKFLEAIEREKLK